MPRKIFWGLWMTVWPVVALIPPLVTAQAPDQSPTVSEEITLGPVQDGGIPAVAVSSESEPVLEEPSDAPQFAAPASDIVEPSVTQSRKTTHRISLPTTEPAEKQLFDSEAFKSSERLPAIEREPATKTNESTVRSKLPRRTGPTLTPQEQLAQQLIQERAMQQANERRARISAKHGYRLPPRPTGKSAGWQPQLTQPNWLAEMDAIE